MCCFANEVLPEIEGILEMSLNRFPAYCVSGDIIEFFRFEDIKKALDEKKSIFEYGDNFEALYYCIEDFASVKDMEAIEKYSNWFDNGDFYDILTDLLSNELLSDDYINAAKAKVDECIKYEMHYEF